MNAELQDKLYKEYPKLFRQKDLPMTQTSMCWGVCTGDGWYNILEVLCYQIQSHVDKKQKENPEFPQVEFVQVKEKFGGLRVYTNGADDVVYSLINYAAGMSGCTCEDCGSPGRNRSYRGWFITHCDSCSEAYCKSQGYTEDKDEDE